MGGAPHQAIPRRPTRLPLPILLASLVFSSILYSSLISLWLIWDGGSFPWVMRSIGSLSLHFFASWMVDKPGMRGMVGHHLLAASIEERK